MYNDKKSAKALYIAFVALQIFLILFVYLFLYSFFLGTVIIIELKELNPYIHYTPISLSTLLLIYITYYTNRIFLKNRRLKALKMFGGIIFLLPVILIWHIESISK